jgi:hypothetical protein
MATAPVTLIFELKYSWYGFTDFEYKNTNLVTCLDSYSTVLSNNYSAYSDLRSALGLVLHPLHLDNLGSYGLSTGYINWLYSYLTSRLYLLLLCIFVTFHCII